MPPDSLPPLDAVIDIARQAGAVIMALYATDFAVRDKHDASPVTLADEQAEAVILAGLRQLTPQIPVISEEAASAGHMPEVAERYWLVDPLDGTKEFIQRNGEFTVNIALIEQDQPRLGVVFAPALGKTGRLYAGQVTPAAPASTAPAAPAPVSAPHPPSVATHAFVEDDTGRQRIHCRPPPADGLTVVASRSHGDLAALEAFLAERRIRVARLTAAGSSLKLCLVAAGQADLYPRLGRTMEWDIAAGHAVLHAAGGQLLSLDGTALRYGKPGRDNPHFIASAATADRHDAQPPPSIMNRAGAT